MVEYNAFQKKAIEFLKNKKVGGIVAPAGSGKTIACVGLYDTLRQSGKIKGKMLILTTVKGVESYRKLKGFEQYKFFFFSTKDIKNSGSSEIDKDADVIVVSNPLLSKNVNNLRNSVMKDVSIVVIDEFHQYRNYKTVLVKSFRELIKGFDLIKIGVSATPFYTNLENSWSLFSLFNLYPFGRYADFYKKYVIYKEIDIWRAVNINGHLERVKERIKQRVAYKNTEEFFSIVKQYFYIEGDNDFSFNYSLHFYDVQDKVKYKKALDEVKKYDRKTLIQKLPEFQKILSFDKNKFNLLLQKVQERIKDSKGLLVFFNYRDTAYFVQNELKKNGITSYVFTGNTKNVEEEIKNLTGKEIVLMTRSPSQSLDFYFDYAVVYEMFFTSGMLEQFLGRMTRYNALYRSVMLDFYIAKGTIEEYFYLRLWELCKRVATSEFLKNLPLSRNISIYKNTNSNSVSFEFLKSILWKGVL